MATIVVKIVLPAYFAVNREPAASRVQTSGWLNVREMVYTPQHIANYFLSAASAEGIPVTPLKLLKLVYIAYGWNLAVLGERLFEEDIEAWQHGPVVPSIYHEFKHFGKKPITSRAVNFDLEDDQFKMVEPVVPDSDDITRLILDRVWSGYKRFSGWALRDKTHEPGTPWTETYRPGVKSLIIPDERIKTHFAEKIEKYLNAAHAA